MAKHKKKKKPEKTEMIFEFVEAIPKHTGYNLSYLSNNFESVKQFVLFGFLTATEFCCCCSFSSIKAFIPLGTEN